MEKNYVVQRGDSFSRPILFTDQDGVAINIFGWTIYLTLKKKIDDTDDDAAYKEDVTIHIDETAGSTAVSIPATITATLDGIYFYDIRYKDDNNIIATILKGTITFDKDITTRS